ncbi:hypothetical protein [Caulobacter sp. 1776]|uniref:hypothetical protein n=1 Tax=Caulobacter sp. 1776 TaxID=3156420 RepID=UPI0033949551
MPCIPFNDGRGRGFICTSAPRVQRCPCGSGLLARLLCDWIVTPAENATCDRKICTTCSTSPANGKDLCPDHTAAWARHPSNPANRSQRV